MLISTARGVLGFTARNAGDTGSNGAYTAAQKDYAIQTAGDELCRRARILIRTDTFPTVASSSSYDSVLPAMFRPDRLMYAYLSGANVTLNVGGVDRDSWEYVEGGAEYAAGNPSTVMLTVCDLGRTLDLIVGQGTQGQPRRLAFSSNTNLRIYPIPNNVFTVNVAWFDFFTTWTAGKPLCLAILSGTAVGTVAMNHAGDTSYSVAPTMKASGGGGTGCLLSGTVAARPDGTNALSFVTVTNHGTGYTSAPTIYANGVNVNDDTLNLPDDAMNKVMQYGATLYLQKAQPDMAFSKESAAGWEAYIEEAKGSIGGLGVQEVSSVRRRR